jgi:hypothetical protein
MRDANIPVKQIRTELEGLIAAGDDGVQKLRALAGGARDAAKDAATLDKALKDNAESAERLAATTKQQLNNALQSLGELILPKVISGLKEANGLLQALANADYEKVGTELGKLLSSIPGVPGDATDFGRVIGGKTSPLAGVFNFAYPAAAQSTARGQPIAALLTGGASGGGAAGSAGSDGVAHRVQEIVRATKDLQSVAAPQIEAFIKELRKLDTPGLIGSNTPLSIEITKLIGSLQNELPNAAKRSSAAAKKATADLAAFVAQAASITAHAAGDQLKEIDAQLLKLTADATKAKALGTPEFASARSALEQQKTDLESARRVAEEEEQRANRIRQQAEDDRVFAEGALAITESRISDVLASAEAVHLGLVGLTDDQVQALIEEEDELTRVLKLEGLNNDERERAARLLVKIRGLLQGTVGENGDPTPKPAKAKDWADEIARGARALLDAATAAGIIDQNLASALAAAINIADAISRIRTKQGSQAANAIGAGAGILSVSSASASTNTGTSVLVGAGEGAAAGAALGPVGAVIGAAVGAIGGLIGAHKKAKEAAEALAHAQEELADQQRNKQGTLLGDIGAENNDLNLRELYAKGLDEEAEALKRAKAEQEEYYKAVNEGFPPEQLARIKQVQEEEDAHTAALKAEAAAQKAAADAAAQAASALDLLNSSLSDIALLGDIAGKSTEDVFKSIDSAKRAFPQFADQLAGIFKNVEYKTNAKGETEFTDAGRETLKANIRNVVAQILGPSGAITDASRPIVQFLDTLLHNVDALAPEVAKGTTGITDLTGSLGGLGDAAETLAQKISGVVSRVQSDGELIGLTPEQIAEKTAKLFNENPDISGLFGKTDVGNQANIEAQKKHAIDILTASPDSPAADAAREFLKFVKSLPGVVVRGEFEPGPTKEGGRLGTEAQSLTQAEGISIVDIERSIYAEARDQTAVLRRIEQLLGSAVPRPISALLPPTAAAIFGSGGSSSAVSLAFHFDVGGVTIGGNAGSADALGLASNVELALAEAVRSTRSPLRRALDEVLGSDFQLAMRVRGGRTVS